MAKHGGLDGKPRRRRWQTAALLCMLAPQLFLLLLSLGTGWSYPGLLPDRLDGGPWQLLSAFSGLLRAALTGAALSLAAAVLSTLFGLLISRALRSSRGLTRRLSEALLLLPFVVSPIPSRNPQLNYDIEHLAAGFEDVAARRSLPFVDAFRPLVDHRGFNDELKNSNFGQPGQLGHGLIAWLVLNQGWYRWLELPEQEI